MQLGIWGEMGACWKKQDSNKKTWNSIKKKTFPQTERDPRDQIMTQTSPTWWVDEFIWIYVWGIPGWQQDSCRGLCHLFFLNHFLSWFSSFLPTAFKQWDCFFLVVSQILSGVFRFLGTPAPPLNPLALAQCLAFKVQAAGKYPWLNGWGTHQLWGPKHLLTMGKCQKTYISWDSNGF